MLKQQPNSEEVISQINTIKIGVNIMQTGNEYEKCVVIKQRSNNQTIAKVYYKHDGNCVVDGNPFGGDGGTVSFGNKSVSVPSHLYTEDILNYHEELAKWSGIMVWKLSLINFLKLS